MKSIIESPWYTPFAFIFVILSGYFIDPVRNAMFVIFFITHGTLHVFSWHDAKSNAHLIIGVITLILAIAALLRFLRFIFIPWGAIWTVFIGMLAVHYLVHTFIEG